jgi:hypothetical protein
LRRSAQNIKRWCCFYLSISQDSSVGNIDCSELQITEMWWGELNSTGSEHGPAAGFADMVVKHA